MKTQVPIPHGSWSAALALVAVVLLLYLPSMTSGFVWDDDDTLTANPLVHAPDGLRRIWLTTDPADYFPVHYSSLWLEWRVWKMNAAGYHVTNVLLHAGICVLLWRIFLRMNVRGAWFAALLFAIHPVNVESVTWITQRKNLLGMLFGCAAALSYLRCRQVEDGGRSHTGYYVLALAAFALSLLSKPIFATLPVLMLIWEVAREERPRTIRSLTGHGLRSLPFFVLSLGLSLVTIWYQYNRAISEIVVREDTFPARLALAGRAVWFYLGKAFLPFNLTFIYPRWEADTGRAATWLPLVLLIVVFAALLPVGRRGRLVAMLLASYVLLLLPVLGFFNIYFMAYSLVADHWQYAALPIPLAGAIALVAGSPKSNRSRLFTQGAAAGVAFVLLALTLSAQQKYRDSETLWKDTLKRNPAAWIAHNNLAGVYSSRGDPQRTEYHLREALRLQPDQADPWLNLGMILLQSGRIEEAETSLQRGLDLKPDAVMGLNNMGVILFRRGEFEAAANLFRRAIEIDPDYAHSHESLAKVLDHLGRKDEAEQHFETARRLHNRR